MATDQEATQRRQCSLLLFVATPTEENALAMAAESRDIPFEKVKDNDLGEYHWLGGVGSETVIAVRPARERGKVVMGALGRLGSAARAIRFREATGVQAIVQLGMAFGIDRQSQQHGDVLVASSLIPYDNRDVIRAAWWSPRRVLPGYDMQYPDANRQPARPELRDLFLREQRRGGHPFGVHMGALLSGAARIHARRFRNELLNGVPGGEDPIIGGEMEGVGLLAASTAGDDPVWCVAKGISDFADERRIHEIGEFRLDACRNAAEFVLAALVNDARQRKNGSRRKEMPTLDDFFKQPADVPLHPRLREWMRRKDEDVDLQLELYRPNAAMGLAQTEMNVLACKNGDKELIDTTLWDEDLNAGLVQLGVPAVDSSQEAERFALALRGAFRKASREFGDGFFNAVLLALIKESDLARYPEIDEVAKYAYGNPPEPSRSHKDCRKMIENEIRGRAQELKKKLNYGDEEAKKILTRAIALYLDERFSVSSRRRMGLL